MKTSLFVENIKCGGCANSIQMKLNNLVNDIVVDEDQGSVSFTYEDEIQIAHVTAALEKMGYPAIGKSKLSHIAKSYVSCMIGRVKK